jgi:hypothetical protein
MNWNNTKQSRPPAKPRRTRNRRVEHLNREIRELRGFLLTAAPRISEILMSGAREEEPMESPGASSANSGAKITDLADLAHRLTVQTTELRLEVAALDSGFKHCGQAFVELLDEVADRLDTLVTPARYRR